MPDAPTLTDGVVTLRALRAQDVEPCREQCVDPESVRWTEVPLGYTLEDAREFCLSHAPRVWADGSEWLFAAEYSGAYAGNLALRDEGHGRAELAFGAHPAVRGVKVDGRSVMERACRLLLDWGFATQKVRVAIWRAEAGNWASRKLAWRLGFSIDGVLRHSLPHRGDLRDGWVGTLRSDEPSEPRHAWLSAPVLLRDRLMLRPLRDSDVPRIVEAWRDADTLRWSVPFDHPVGTDDGHDWLDSRTEQSAVGRGLTWAVADLESDLLVGAVDLFDFEGAVAATIGYWVHPGHRRQGIAGIALELALGSAFTQFNRQVVRARAAVENRTSRRVLERAGMRLVGVERLGTPGRYGPLDNARYEIAAEDFLF